MSSVLEGGKYGKAYHLQYLIINVKKGLPRKVSGYKDDLDWRSEDDMGV